MQLLGTPFPVSEAGDRNKFVPVWKQEARDEQGRKHFHGAFTGGFSAGYHNTVGSREGWTPASFVSSRSLRQKQDQRHEHTVEQYMDEEDLGEMRRQSKLITTEPFQNYHVGATVSEPAAIRVAEMIVARREGLGWRLLRKMGWQGQTNETGPATRLLQAARAKTLRPLFSRDGDRDASNSTKTPRSTGFGVGVLEDEDADEDIYHSAGPANFVTSIRVHEKGDHKNPEKKGPASPPKGSLAGFVPATATVDPASVIYPPPIVPRGFVPRGLGLGPPSKPALLPRGTRGLTPEERGSILGERPLPRPTRPADQAGEAAIDGMLAEARSLPRTPSLDVPTAMSALRGYMPFQNDPVKDARYQQFLRHHAAPSSTPLPERPEKMSHADFVREQEDFCKAATMYRPLPATMASKFVSSKKTPILDPAAVRTGLYKPEPKPAVDPQPPVMCSEKEGITASSLPAEQKPLLPYGKQTRTEIPWTPSSILCKRYSIEPPNKEASDAASPSPAPSLLSLQSVQKIVAGSSYADKVTLISSETTSEPASEVPQAVVEIAENLDRPEMDLFKAIFGDQSDEEASLEEEMGEGEKSSQVKSAVGEKAGQNKGPDQVSSNQQTDSTGVIAESPPVLSEPTGDVTAEPTREKCTQEKKPHKERAERDKRHDKDKRRRDKHEKNDRHDKDKGHRDKHEKNDRHDKDKRHRDKHEKNDRHDKDKRHRDKHEKRERDKHEKRDGGRPKRPKVLYIEENVNFASKAASEKTHAPPQATNSNSKPTPTPTAVETAPTSLGYEELMEGKRRKRPAASDLW